MLVTNEGNARLATSLPKLHFVLAGVEKLIPSWADAADQLRLLPRSATAQTLSTYTTCITGAQPGKEMQILLIDNGRRRMRADPAVADALRCIRCGACANVCPPYQVVGGHAFGHIYTGAIGLVNTSFHHSLEEAAGPQGLCVSCGACEQVCPVAIPLPAQILDVRRRAVEQGHAPAWERWALRLWSQPALFRAAMRLAAVGSAALAALGRQERRHLKLPLPRRFRWRSLPAVPWRSARDRIAHAPGRQPQIAQTDASGQTVDLFLQCLADRLLPESADGARRLLEAAGANVDVPPDQHCCGLPAFDAGDHDTARTMAKQTIQALEGRGRDIVTPAPSCVVSMRQHWPRLFDDDPSWLARAAAVADRVHDLADYLQGPARLPDGCLSPAADVHQPYAVHRFCQATNLMGQGDAVPNLVARLTGSDPSHLEEDTVCCGFGGLTSIAAPEMGAGILERKLDCVAECSPDTLLSNNPGCILHLRAGAHARHMPHRTRHYADFLASLLPSPRGRRDYDKQSDRT